MLVPQTKTGAESIASSSMAASSSPALEEAGVEGVAGVKWGPRRRREEGVEKDEEGTGGVW